MSDKTYELRLDLTAREIAALWATIEYTHGNAASSNPYFLSLRDKWMAWFTTNAPAIRQVERTQEAVHQ